LGKKLLIFRKYYFFQLTFVRLVRTNNKAQQQTWQEKLFFALNEFVFNLYKIFRI